VRTCARWLCVSYLSVDKSVQPASGRQKEDSRLAMYEHTSKGPPHCRSFIGSSARVRFDGGLPAFGPASFKRLRRTSLMEVGMPFAKWNEVPVRLRQTVRRPRREMMLD